MEHFSRLASTEEPAAQTAADTFRFVFSNEKVGRDGHVVRNNGIQHDNYDRNNIVLFAHDDTEPPIGRGSNIDTSGVNCRMDVTFAPRDVLPFAGTIRDLVAGKWLRALSMSWQPIEWKFSSDKSRPGGMDFTKVDLLEISVVPLPALPDALLDARSYGVDTKPLYEWAERALDMANYRNVPRGELEALCRAARPAVSRSTRRREDAGYAERRLRARLLRDQAPKISSGVRDLLTEAAKHHDRAAEHHALVRDQHEAIGDHLDDLQDVHQRTTSTLAELGIDDPKVTRCLTDIKRCSRKIHEYNSSAQVLADSAADSVRQAQLCVRAVLDHASAEPAPASGSAPAVGSDQTGEIADGGGRPPKGLKL
jgi:prohead serine protease